VVLRAQSSFTKSRELLLSLVPTTPVGSALSTNSRPAIATARHFGDPESPINVLGARYLEPELLCVQRETEIAEFNSLCRYNNAEADRSRYSSPRQLRQALITIVTNSYTLIHGSAQTLDNGDAERNGPAVSHGEQRLESRLLTRATQRHTLRGKDSD
jgi:hypothetical protein